MTTEPSVEPTLHVLVVEDGRDQREQLAMALERLGCRVSLATDGREALRCVRRSKPEVVLMDLGLPYVDGWDAIGLIRREAKTAEPYIIAVSGHADADARRAAFVAGCNEYVVKPFDVRGALRAYVYRMQKGALLASDSGSFAVDRR